MESLQNAVCDRQSACEANEMALCRQPEVAELSFAVCVADANVDVLAEASQEPQQSLDGVAVEVAPQHVRDLGLANAEELAGLGLRELPVPEVAADEGSKACRVPGARERSRGLWAGEHA